MNGTSGDGVLRSTSLAERIDGGAEAGTLRDGGQ